MIEIYLYGCNCGVTGLLIRKVKRYAKENNIDVVVYRTKYDPDKRRQHMDLLLDNDLPVDSIPAIVVYNDNVSLLKTWTY